MGWISMNGILMSGVDIGIAVGIAAFVWWFKNSMGTLVVASIQQEFKKALEAEKSRLQLIQETEKSRLQLCQALVAKRVEAYAGFSESLNNIYCYLIRIGPWKNFYPQEIIEYKRLLDQQFFIAEPYWTPEVVAAYRQFIDSCFKTYNGHGEDARIKAESAQYQVVINGDADQDTINEDDYSKYFAEGFNQTKVKQDHQKLMQAFKHVFVCVE